MIDEVCMVAKKIKSKQGKKAKQIKPNQRAKNRAASHVDIS
jgi:hypothetical protein